MNHYQILNHRLVTSVIQNQVTFDSSGADTQPSTAAVRGDHDLLRYSTVNKVGNINVMVSGDKLNFSCITGCCFMPGGQLVLYDFVNKKIKLLLNRNASLSIVGSLAIPVGDWDTSVAADYNNVVVTVASKKQIQFVQVLPLLKLGRTFDTDMACNGVAVAAGKIFVLCENNNTTDTIRVYDLEGKYLGKEYDINHSSTKAFVSPICFIVSCLGDKVYVSDEDTHAVSCLSVDGRMLFQYKDDELQRPVGLFVDNTDNVIVCGANNNNLQVITSAGKKHNILLTSKLRISNPMCVGVRPTDGTLVVGRWESKASVVFKMA